MTHQILYTRELPGDIKIKIGRRDYRGGQQAGSPRPECRVTKPGWDSGWHGAHVGSVFKLKAWWDLVEVEADIPVAWAETVGGIWPPPRYDDVFEEGAKWLDTL